MGTLHIPFCRGWRWVDGTSLVSPEGEVASERSPSFPHWPKCCTREDRCRLLEVIPTPWAPWPYFCLSWVLSQKRTHTEWCLQPSWICLCCHDNSESCSCSLSLCSFHRLQSSLSLSFSPSILLPPHHIIISNYHGICPPTLHYSLSACFSSKTVGSLTLPTPGLGSVLWPYRGP